jgi:methylated-DNA-[protein]-cysteine S-methyltransferase
MMRNGVPLNDFIAAEESAARYLQTLLLTSNRRQPATAPRPQAAVAMLTLSPVGSLMVATSADGIALIHFLRKRSDPADALARLRRRFDPVIDQEVATRVGEELRRFMSGDEAALRSKLDLSLVNGAFQRRVLERLLQVGAGAILTYSSLAAWVNAPDAARAVGGAMHDNPIPIYVPCHRVVRSDLSLGGYGGGLELKRKLLEIEGFSFTPSGKVSQNGAVWKEHLEKRNEKGEMRGKEPDRRHALLFRDPARAREGKEVRGEE